MSKKRKLTLQQKRRVSKQKKQTDFTATDDSREEAEYELRQGLVIAHYGSEVLIEDENEQQRCFFRSHMDLAVGDKVGWHENQDGLGVVEKQFERSTQIQRPDSYGDVKTVAANITQMLITIAPHPEPHSALIDRYIVAAHFHGIAPIILVNKCELIDDATLAPLLDRYRHLEYSVLKVSAKDGTGIDDLKEHLKDNTSIFVGQSGVGKSSLVKTLLPEEEIRIGELSDAEVKGKHTTTHSQLYRFPSGGCCIDSPGIREFGLWHVTKEDVLSGFKEIHEQTFLCKFRDCQHESEPGCGVKDALENGKIHVERFQNYQLIVNQLEDVEIKTRDKIKNK